MKLHESYEQQKDIAYQLDLLREQLHECAYPGYPRQADRLVAMSPADLAYDADGRLVLPDGPWNAGSGDTALPTVTEQQGFADRGLVLDAKGRPLHPWFLRMIADPLIGVALSKGMFRHWADNPTADAAVIKRNHVLLVKRRGTGQWALPGGFVNPGEKVLAAAKRETGEETGLAIPDDAPMLPLYQGPIAGIRMTAHAWPETTALMFRLPDRGGRLPAVRGGDDAEVARWFPLDEIQESNIALFGAHRFLLNRAIERVRLAEAGEPQPLDLSEKVWTELLAAAPVYANVYGKNVIVHMRPAIPGERIETILADGTLETVNMAGENQVVITNPGGEQYILDAAKAARRYAPTDEPGMHRARGMVRALTNLTGYSVAIRAPWGAFQCQGPDCKIAALFDPEEPDTVDDDRYFIGAAEFATYEKAEEPKS